MNILFWNDRTRLMNNTRDQTVDTFHILYSGQLEIRLSVDTTNRQTCIPL